jgi:hypothetical protein
MKLNKQISRIKNIMGLDKSNLDLIETDILNESFLESQNYIYDISKKIVKHLDVIPIFNHIFDDIENSTDIDITLDNYEINVNNILYDYSQKEDISDEFSEFSSFYGNLKIIFTNRLPRNVYGKVVYSFRDTIIYVNYNKQKVNGLLFDKLEKINFNLSKDQLMFLIKKHIISGYVDTISHELRHLYDDYRSDDKMDGIYTDNIGDDYLKQNSEIWSRFTEILNSISRSKLKPKKNFNTCYKFLEDNFDGFNLLPLKSRSKLTSYLYRFLDNKIKKNYENNNHRITTKKTFRN